jgi:hypothetical protein
MTTNDPNQPTWNIVATAIGLIAPPTGVVQIGGGNLNVNNFVPWSPNARYSISQVIYYPGEINITDGDIITQLQYQFNGFSAFTQTIQVFMGYTNKIMFETLPSNPATSNDWISMQNYFMVFEGEVTTPNSANPDLNWVSIVLDVPMVYDSSSNLVIVVNEIQGGAAQASGNAFVSQAVPRNRALTMTRTTDPHIDAIHLLDQGTVRSFIPNTRLVSAPPPDGAYITASPARLNYGSIFQGQPAPRTLTLRNIGTETLNVTEISSNIVNVSPNQIQIAPGDMQIITITVNAEVTGLLNETVVFNSNALNGALTVQFILLHLRVSYR